MSINRRPASQRIGLAALILGLLVALLLITRSTDKPTSDPESVEPTPIAKQADRGKDDPAGEALAPAVIMPSPPVGRFGRLDKGVSISGSVHSRADGTPVDGAEVSFFLADRLLSSVTSDAEGSFRFEQPRAIDLELAIVEAAGFFPFAHDLGQSPLRFSLQKGDAVSGVIIELDPETEFRGEVVDAEKNPIADASIRLVDSGRVHGGFFPPDQQWVSDSSGRFLFSAPPGSWLQTTHPDFAAARSRIGFGVTLARKLVVRLEKPQTDADGTTAQPQPPQQRIGGRVVDAASGVGFGGARIRLSAGALAVQTVSESDGRFSVDLPAAGPFRVQARAPGYAPTRLVQLVSRAKIRQYQTFLPLSSCECRLRVDTVEKLLNSITTKFLGIFLGTRRAI